MQGLAERPGGLFSSRAIDHDGYQIQCMMRIVLPQVMKSFKTDSGSLLQHVNHFDVARVTWHGTTLSGTNAPINATSAFSQLSPAPLYKSQLMKNPNWECRFSLTPIPSACCCSTRRSIDAQAAARHQPMTSAPDLSGAIDQLLYQQSGYWLAGKTTGYGKKKEGSTRLTHLSAFVRSGRGYSTDLRLDSLLRPRSSVHLQGSMVACQSLVYLSSVCYDGTSCRNGLWYGQSHFLASPCSLVPIFNPC